MNWKTPEDRIVKIHPAKYRIDWARKVSGPQLRVKNFLFPYWQKDVVCEELYLNIGKGRKFRYDLVNLNKKCIVEVSPDSTHLEYNHFMHGSAPKYRKRLESDVLKMEMAELNEFTFIELHDEHLNNLTKKMFKETFDLDL